MEFMHEFIRRKNIKFLETMITIFERGPGLVANGGDS